MLQVICERSRESATEGTISFFLFHRCPYLRQIIEVKITCANEFIVLGFFFFLPEFEPGDKETGTKTLLLHFPSLAVYCIVAEMHASIWNLAPVSVAICSGSREAIRGLFLGVHRLI